MRWFDRLRRRRVGPSVNPGKPHAFDPIQDAGLGAMASGAGGGAGGQPPGMSSTLAGKVERSARCAVPGCARERDDPIHWPEA